jgi:SulP family sulfate permease
LGSRFPIRTDTLRADGVAGIVLGVQSVPDGLATGLLAGVNPLAGLYAYMVGTFTGALVTSSSFMAIQGTGAMAMIVADVPGLPASL